MISSSQGIILKVFPYSNTSVILNVFTEDLGKLTFIAKGIRKPKNPLLSILQPFNLLEFQYYYKKNRSMQLIKDADILVSFDHLRSDLKSIFFASIILNIINRTFEQEYSNSVLFRLIFKTLGYLSFKNNNNKLYFLFFMFHLSKQLGFMPNFERCHSCNMLFEYDAIFSLSSNSLICANCNINNVLDTDIVVSNEGLSFLNLLNTTNINKIIDLKISQEYLKELYIFLIAFTKCNINYMENVKGFKEIDKIYHES